MKRPAMKEPRGQLGQFHMQSWQGLCKLASSGSKKQIANDRTDRAIKKYA